MPTDTSQSSSAGGASCGNEPSRTAAGTSVSGVAFELSESKQLALSGIDPAVPVADANPLPAFFCRVHPAHQAPPATAPAEELQLRDWLVDQARLSQRVAAELATELYRHQAVENLDDLREFSGLPEFAECVQAALVRKRVLDALARASALLPAAPPPPQSPSQPPATPPRRPPPSSPPGDGDERTPPPAPSKPPPPRSHAGGARRTLFANAPTEPAASTSDSLDAPPARESESDVSGPDTVPARLDALRAADLPFSPAQMDAIHGRSLITADQWHALDLADRSFKLYNPLHLALSIPMHDSPHAPSVSPDHITPSSADRPSEAAARPKEETPEGPAPPSNSDVTGGFESYCGWPTTWPSDDFDFFFGADFKPFLDCPPVRKPGWLPSPWPQSARCNACGKYSRPALLELGIDPDEREFMCEPPYAPRGTIPSPGCFARLGECFAWAARRANFCDEQGPVPIGWESDYHIESAARFFFSRTAPNGAAVFDAGSGGVGLAALTWPPKWPPVSLRRQRLKHGLPMTVSDVLPAYRGSCCGALASDDEFDGFDDDVGY